MFDGASSRRCGINATGYDPNTGTATPVGLNYIGVAGALISGDIHFPLDGRLSFVQLHTTQLSNDWAAYDSAMLSDQAAFWGKWRSHSSVQGGKSLPDTTIIDYTITHEVQVGGWAAGAGFGMPCFSHETKPGAMSSVIWGGGRNNDEVMWQYNAQQAVYEKFNLWGASRAELNGTPDKVPVALLVDKVPGFLDVGVGSLVLRDICISWADIGIKGATDQDMANCELVTTERVFFDRCTTAVQINNTQGLGWRHVSPTIGGCGTFLEYVAGGDLHVDNATLISEAPHTYLRLVNTSEGHGPNASKFTIREVKVDNISVDAVMLEMEEGGLYYAEIIFEDLHFPGEEWNNPAFLVTGQTTLFLDRVKNLQPGMIKILNSGDTYSPRIVITDTSLTAQINSATDLIDNSSTGKCHLVTRGLYSNNDPHFTIPDYDGLV